MTIGLYVGSFDPITLGHMDIIRQAKLTFDHIHVGIGQNPKKEKKELFYLDERIRLIERSLRDQNFNLDDFTISNYTGSMMQKARDVNATAIIRGLRQISDFGDEFTINGMVARTLKDVPMTYFICRQDFLHVSSSSVKEMASLGEDYGWMVTPSVYSALSALYS